MVVLFFFSSRRRHTRCSRDWSSDVCSSDLAKPSGLVWVPPGGEARFLAPLPVRKIPGIGEVTERALRALGLETVEQLAAVSQEKLERIFGQWGEALYRKESEEHTSELQSRLHLVCRL